jgi:hypothetical protein
VSRKEMQATLALRFGGEGILKVKGIPFKAGAGDVRKFFSGYKIKPEGVSFIMHADGRPTGMAFIEFETPQEAVRAMVSYPMRWFCTRVWGRRVAGQGKLMESLGVAVVFGDGARWAARPTGDWRACLQHAAGCMQTGVGCAGLLT